MGGAYLGHKWDERSYTRGPFHHVRTLDEKSVTWKRTLSRPS